MQRRELFKMLGLTALVAPLAAVVGKAEAQGTFLPDGNVHLESYWLGWDDARSTATPASASWCEQHGSDDCTAAIQAGIDRARETGEPYMILGGRHHLSQTIDITRARNVMIAGADFDLDPGVIGVAYARLTDA
jgi:hypothetical protein